MNVYERKCDAKKLFEILARVEKPCILDENILYADIGAVSFGFRFDGSDFEREEVSLCGLKRIENGYELIVCSYSDEAEEEKTYKVASAEAFAVFRDIRLSCDAFTRSPLEEVLTVSEVLTFVSWFYGEELLSEKEKELCRAGEFLNAINGDLYYLSGYSARKCAEYVADKNPELKDAFYRLRDLFGMRKCAKTKLVRFIRRQLDAGDIFDEKKAVELCNEVCAAYEPTEPIDLQEINELRKRANEEAHRFNWQGDFPRYENGAKYIEFKGFHCRYEKDGKTRFYDVGVSYGDKEKGLLFKSPLSKSDVLPIYYMSAEDKPDIHILIEGITDILDGKTPSADFDTLPDIVLQTSARTYPDAVRFLLIIGALLIGAGLLLYFTGVGADFVKYSPSCFAPIALGAASAVFAIVLNTNKKRRVYISKE